MAGLDDSLKLDPAQSWNDIANHVAQDIMPAIERAMSARIVHTKTELRYVLQQLHRHRRESYTISLDPNKVKSDKRRKGINTRRAEVINCLLFAKYIELQLLRLLLLYSIQEKGQAKAWNQPHVQYG